MRRQQAATTLARLLTPTLLAAEQQLPSLRILADKTALLQHAPAPARLLHTARRHATARYYHSSVLPIELRTALLRSHELAVSTWHTSNAYLHGSAKALWLALQQAGCGSGWPSWAATSLSWKFPGGKTSLSIPWSRLPSREWFLRPGFDTRVAILNAMYTVGGNVHRCLPLLLAQALRKDGYLAHCFLDSSPPVDTIRLLHAHTKDHPPRSIIQELRFTLGSLFRLAQLSCVFGPLLLLAPVALIYNIGRDAWLSWFRLALQSSGPAFIKWGQWAATRADLFPRDMCAELAKLQTQAPSHDLRHTEEAFFNSFGCAIHDLFTTFEPEPIASGSIGQIYRAVVGPRGAQYTGVKEGRTVAVKVRHPGVTDAIERDFSLMLWAAHVAANVPGLAHLRLEDSLRQFAAPLREQVDFTLEALHLWQFAYNFRRSPNVHFPFPIYPLVSPEVLVETYEDGALVSEYVEKGDTGPFSKQLATMGCSAFLQMMLVDNLIHADLHPGNILVRLQPPRNPLKRLPYEALRLARGTPPESMLEPHFILLDVGMANWLTPADQDNMMGLFHGLVNLDGHDIGKYTLAFAGDEQSCSDVPGFLAQLDEYFEELKSADSWQETRFSNGADAMAAALEFVRRYKVNLPGNVCAVLMTTLVLEGWSSKLNPQHSVLEQVEDVLRRHESSLSTRMSRWMGGNPQHTLVTV